MKLLSIAVALALLLLFGCASLGGSNQAQQQPASAPTVFSLSPSPFPYTAHYTIDEGTDEITKTVWRKGTLARVDLEVTPGAAISLYFISGKGYSCSVAGGKMECFTISAPSQQSSLGGIFDLPDVSGGTPLGTVAIGNSEGACYLLPYTATSKRKVCLTDRNVLAYDEYNVSAGTTHVEYLTSIYYSADDSAFALPAIPQAAPQN